VDDDAGRDGPGQDDGELLTDARALAPELAGLRHDLHRIPEVGLHLPRTQARVLAALEGLPLEVSTGTGLSSVVAVLRGGRPGPSILLRGDMDALPVTEESGEPFLSEHDGVMHACGHDLHVAALVGAARLLAARRNRLPGSVVLMFQPGEEGPHGARHMIEEGVLDAAGDRVVAAYATHVTSALLPCGVVSGRPGTAMAAADQMYVTVHGRGGHGSTPHRAADPVTVAAEIVLALQTAVTRQFDAHDPVVVSVGRLAAGTIDNVIPATAELDATVRTFSPEHHAAAPERLERLVTHIATAHGLTADVRYVRGYPVTVNDPVELDRVAHVTTALLGDGAWMPAQRPISGSEDFSYVLEQVPGAFVFVGATPPDEDPATAPYNHSARARFDDRAIPVAAAVLAGLALDRLAQGRIAED
jgi:amidohydrolase